VQTVTTNKQRFIRRRCLAASERDISCFTTCYVFLFFSSDVTAQQCLNGVSPNFFTAIFAVLFVIGDTPIKIGLPQIFAAQNVHFLERKFRLCRLRTAAAQKREGILGKLKQLV